jgi:hypothetical protein
LKNIIWRAENLIKELADGWVFLFPPSKKLIMIYGEREYTLEQVEAAIKAAERFVKEVEIKIKKK